MTTPQPAALPDLTAVIAWLENGCDPSEAVKELKHYQSKLRALATLQSQPAEVSDEPEQASKVVNDSCWKFVEAMPHKIPGPIWNDLKPAIYAALIHYHRAILALRPQSYPLPDDLYDSKDWRQGNYASRVEWLHTMYEHAKQERDEYAAQLEALRPQAVPMTDERAVLEDEEFSLLSQTQVAALLWVLWCHQGASSPVGQPIRFALGMDKRQAMSDEQVSAAQRFRIDWHQWSGITAPAGGEKQA